MQHLLSFSYFHYDFVLMWMNWIRVQKNNPDTEELNPNLTVLMWMISFCFSKIKGPFLIILFFLPFLLWIWFFLPSFLIISLQKVDFLVGFVLGTTVSLKKVVFVSCYLFLVEFQLNSVDFVSCHLFLLQHYDFQSFRTMTFKKLIYNLKGCCCLIF